MHSLSIADVLLPWWAECCFILFFLIGYHLFQVFGPHRDPLNRKKESRAGSAAHLTASAESSHCIERKFVAGCAAAVVEHWRSKQVTVASSPETLRAVVQALITTSPDTAVDEIHSHLIIHSRLCNSKYASIILDAVARSKKPHLLDEFSDLCHHRLGIPITSQWYDTLLAGHAFAGSERTVKELCEKIEQDGGAVSARARVLIVKGFLSKGLLDESLEHVRVMFKDGFSVSNYVVGSLFRVAAEQQKVTDIFRFCETEGFPLPEDTLEIVLEDCAKRGDPQTGRSLEAVLRSRSRGKLPAWAFSPLLKVEVVTGGEQAKKLWKEMKQECPMRITDELCAGLLARCAQSKYMIFADVVYDHCRRSGISLQLSLAMMKVCSSCGLNKRVFDLYREVEANNIAPDAAMCHYLLRIAAEQGRGDICNSLAKRLPKGDVGKSMHLIKIAGKNKDLDAVFTLLEEVKAESEKIDVSVYNCVLDACMNSQDFERGQSVLKEMKDRFGKLDVISYNILLKGISSTGDIEGSRSFVADMKQNGVQPNDVSFNCLINAVACAGDFDKALETVDSMKANGFAPDHFTFVVLLKAIKRRGRRADVDRVLELMEVAGIDVCKEEALMILLLDVFAVTGNWSRLEHLLSLQERSASRPSLFLFRALIKGNSHLKRLGKCKVLWNTMTQECGYEPNQIVLGCMMDAFVANHDVAAASVLFRQWGKQVGPNLIMYSILIKGFAAESKNELAMELWHEMRAEGISVNTVVYNALIDSQARIGNSDNISHLLKGMKEEGVAPDSITYSTMLKSSCVRGDLEGALNALKEMQSMGWAPNCVVYNTILDWSIKWDRMDVAETLLADFESSTIRPSTVTLGIMVKLYGRRRMLWRAFEVCEKWPALYGLKPNLQVWTCLISACIMNASPERAVAVFRKIPAGSVDSKCFVVLLNGLLWAGKACEVADLVREAYGLDGQMRSLAPHEELPMWLMESLCRALHLQGLVEKVGLPLLKSFAAIRTELNLNILRASLLQVYER